MTWQIKFEFYTGLVPLRKPDFWCVKFGDPRGTRRGFEIGRFCVAIQYGSFI